MDGNSVALIIAAILGGSLIQSVLDYLKSRISAKAQGEVAAATVSAQIETTEMASLSAKLSYLESLLQHQREYIKSLQEDRNAADERARRWETRVRELEEQQELLQKQIRELRSS